MTDLQLELVGAALGWLGTIGTFTAYVLIWRGWVPTTAKRYSALNAVGGLLAAGGALVYEAWPAVASNVVWALIGVHGLVTALLSSRKATSSGVSSRKAPGTVRPAPAGLDPAPPLTSEEQALFEALTQPLPVITPAMLGRDDQPEELPRDLPAPIPAVRG